MDWSCPHSFVRPPLPVANHFICICWRSPQGQVILILGYSLLLVSRNACRPSADWHIRDLYQPGSGPRAQSIAVKAPDIFSPQVGRKFRGTR